MKILDCTLRDGGYLNNWNFGSNNIVRIVNDLNNALIDIIEVGFLENIPAFKYDRNRSFFNDVDQIKSILPTYKRCEQYVAMTRFGNLNINELKPFDGRSIDGIRVTFHISDVDEALIFSKAIMDKGYKVYVQPVGTTMYSDEQLLSLVKKVNELEPYAFYVVDTLGIMHETDIHRVFYLVDNNLSNRILRGFHSHNNLQMSFSNAQTLSKMRLQSDIIMDSTVNGMGRGAGNLNTELIAENLNTNYDSEYNLEHLLEIIDNYMKHARSEMSWGYSLPYYLAATKNCHPSYATYIDNKRTLPVSDIAKILSMIPKEESELFDNQLIEKLYFNYQNHVIDDSKCIGDLKEELKNRIILLVAPGKTNKTHYHKIKSFIEKYCPVIITINFVSSNYETDYIFISNQKRYNQFSSEISNSKNKLILTSNVDSESDYKLNYNSLLNDFSDINDNATLMLIKFLETIHMKKVYIAGFDGYDTDEGDSYIEESMETLLDIDVYRKINTQISKYLKMMKHIIDIDFITPSKYIINK